MCPEEGRRVLRRHVEKAVPVRAARPHHLRALFAARWSERATRHGCKVWGVIATCTSRAGPSGRRPSHWPTPRRAPSCSARACSRWRPWRARAGRWDRSRTRTGRPHKAGRVAGAAAGNSLDHLLARVVETTRANLALGGRAELARRTLCPPQQSAAAAGGRELA